MPRRSKGSKRSKHNNTNQIRESNGDFSKRIQLCRACAVLPFQPTDDDPGDELDRELPSVDTDTFAVFEILEDDEDVTDDFTEENEVWSQIIDSEGEDEELSNISFDEDTIDEFIDTVNLKWRDTHKNSNVRGAGSSRSTYYRKEELKQSLQHNAIKFPSPIHRWLQPKKSEEISDDTFIADLIENPAPNLAKKATSNEEPKFTIITAMEYLVTHEAMISKNQRINKAMAKDINFWYYICSLALYQYFAHLRYSLSTKINLFYFIFHN